MTVSELDGQENRVARAILNEALHRLRPFGDKNREAATAATAYIAWVYGVTWADIGYTIHAEPQAAFQTCIAMRADNPDYDAAVVDLLIDLQTGKLMRDAA